MRALVLLLAAFFFLPEMGIGQVSQVVRGRILDGDRQVGLAGATVAITSTEPQTGTVTDSSGFFRLEEIPVGRHQLAVQYVGYEQVLVPELLVESGKEQVLELALFPATESLREVLVQADRLPTRHPVSVQTITVEQVLRYPATYYDPAKLAASLPGVVNNNDQANGLMIRGNAPGGMTWLLEGLEIVNPNHTANAGTSNDRFTRNAGGVNILSAQLLNTSNFYTGAFPAQFGNALSGVMDMRLRPGNNETNEFTLQAGLIGLDLAAEGPVSKKSKASYLVNYRYSTVGLLSSLGVDFGEEEIQFQDLAFHLVFPTEKAGRFTVFGMGGLSLNLFEGQSDSTLWEESRDPFDVEFESKMGAVGFTHTMSVGKRWVVHSALALSYLEYIRSATPYATDGTFDTDRTERDYLEEGKLAFLHRWDWKLGPGKKVRVGLQGFNQPVYWQQDLILANGLEIESNVSEVFFPVVPFMDYNWQIHPKLNFTVGLRYILDKNERTYWEPRGSLQWALDEQNDLSFAYGLHSQLPAPILLAEHPEGLDRTRAHHFVLGYGRQLGASGRITLEAYYQFLFDVPVDRFTTFSAVNINEYFWLRPRSLESAGEAANMGIEINWQHYLTDSWYFLVNGTVYNARYRSYGGNILSGRYNGNYIFNGTFGREFKWIKKNKPKGLGLNGRVVWVGGFRSQQINESISQAWGITYFEETGGFDVKLPDYFKIDFRVYYKWNHPRRSSTLALDIQNLTNRKNVAYRYYDVIQEQVVDRYQLGLIPILSYRINF